MRQWFASHSVVAIALLFVVGTGCGSSFGGCGTLKPLPTGTSGPFGLPPSQVIEGGIQARLTAPGLKKFSVIIEQLLASNLNMTLGCIVKENKIFNDVGDFFGWIVLCPDVQPSCGQSACGGSVVFNSKDRPAPYNFDDGKDNADFSMADGTNQVMNVSLSFDLDVNIKASYGYPFGAGSGSCNFEIYTKHFKGDVNQPNLALTLPLQLGIDPVTGKLKLSALPLNISALGLATNTTGCGFLDDIVDGIFNTLLDGLNSSLGLTIINLISPLLQGPINSLIANLLPNPLGLAGTVDTATMLAAYDAPPEAGLETYIVPGGYVASKDRGLTLGILAGMNSDANPTTRTDTTSSEPSLCVPARPVLDLGSAPWNLPMEATRKSHTLNAADPFAGMPDPVNPAGQIRDLTLGISRTYLDLVGFHLVNSGSLCLHVDGSKVSMLSTGTLGLLVPSLGAIAENPKAPLQLVLRPQKPISFTLGAGTATDALMHVAINDLRIDMYTWIEERWVRFLTLGLDLNIDINLTVTKDMMGNPQLQPMLSGLNAADVTVHVTNSDLLAELPSQLETMLPSLITLAASGLTGSLPAVALPTVMGFSLDDLSVGHVQSPQDDFLGLFATIKTPASTAPVLDWSDPQHPRIAGELKTFASVAGLAVPPPEQLQALFDAKATAVPARPTVTLALGSEGNDGRDVEFAWKIDGSAWRPWTRDAHPVLDYDEFLLQGHHKITVRSRKVGDYRTEDSQPPTLDVIIDSVAPIVKPHLDAKDQNKLVFGGWDLVTDDDKLEYAYVDGIGNLKPFTKDGSLTLAEVGEITHNGVNPLIVSVRDEAGLVGTYPVDVVPYGHGNWGHPVASSGCGCELGGRPTNNTGAWIVVFAASLFLMRRRGWRRIRRFLDVKSLGWLALVVSTSFVLVGCGCDKNDQQCRVDDECSSLMCDAGKIPQCQQNMCVCTPDIPKGNQGDYSSMTVIDSTAFVAAYNSTYGDLMIGSIEPPGRIDNWTFVDGVPEEAPATVGSHVRGGISEPGDDVGKFTSIARTHHGEPVIAYYDATNGALKFASFGAIRWHTHVVDKGAGLPETMGDEIGTWTSMTIDSMGRPGIAYTAIVHSTGQDEGQLRFAQATTDDPQSAADWTITIVDSRKMPVKLPTDMTLDLLPNAIAIMTASARKLDDSPAIAYYDRERGNLRYAELTAGKWVTSILDGEATNAMNMPVDTGDVGQYPSITFDTGGVAHISYVDASRDNLLYVNTQDKAPVVVDDGYRPMDETTSDGLPSPVFHLVGDSSSIQIAGDNMIVAYQDSTSVQLRMAIRDGAGKWTTQSVAGHASPFVGSYGFWANAQVGGRGVYLGSYGINQQATPAQYFFEIFFVDLGLQM